MPARYKCGHCEYVWIKRVSEPIPSITTCPKCKNRSMVRFGASDRRTVEVKEPIKPVETRKPSRFESIID